MIKSEFFEQALKYTDDNKVVERLWEEICQQYQYKERHYHNLDHLNNFLADLYDVKTLLKKWDAMIFALVYHDIIQNAGAGKNEIMSAELAADRLNSINFPKDLIELCRRAILATKKHSEEKTADINYFTDADLGILGKSWTEYKAYAENVRKEYPNVPDFFFKNSRKKLLQAMLKQPRIYKSEHFYKKYEAQARLNIEKEIDDML